MIDGGWTPAPLRRARAVGALIVSLALDLGLFIAVFMLLTSYPATVRKILPGRDPRHLLWQILQHAGAYLVVHEVKHPSDTYAALALVLGTLAWLRLGAQVSLYRRRSTSCVLRLWPRPLLGDE